MADRGHDIPVLFGQDPNMKQKQQIYCLALHPQAASHGSIDINGLQVNLQDLGLLGEAVMFNGEQRYRLGERFYQWLTFMGCAPALRLEPNEPGDEKFCHFRLFELPQIAFRYLRAEAKARCPNCSKPGATADEIYQNYILKHLDWSCPHCQQSVSPPDIYWKHEAGMSRTFIELLDIHPHEVVPTDSLIKALESATEQRWQYFYSFI